MDYRSVINRADQLTEGLAGQVECDGENGALSAAYYVASTDSLGKPSLLRVAQQVGANLKSEFPQLVEGYFTEVEPKDGKLMIHLFVVYKRPNPTHI